MVHNLPQPGLLLGEKAGLREDSKTKFIPAVVHHK
jgi:hypothetical protein